MADKSDTNNNNNNPPKDKKKESKGFTVKTPKGTKDYGPLECSIREKIFQQVTSLFKKHGAVTIETPLFELKEILTGKYGEDSKLIFDLEDQGGELSSLRYDLTVPFARYMAQNKIKQIKRYQIGRVYRRDQPMMNKGRYREFYQCDFDIAGDYDLMIPDAEAIALMIEIIGSFKEQLGPFKVKLNHRKLLDGIFEICGVPSEKFRAICSAVDKLDKTPWDEVRTEMVGPKGLDPSIADKIQKYVELNGEPRQLLKKMKDENLLVNSKSALTAAAELDVLFEYLDAFGVLSYVSLDMSLARGLDYYTGVIYECVLTGKNQVGSIAAGGRYDELIGLFSGNKSIPSVGFSVGIERIFTILEKQLKQTSRSIQTQVFVASVDKGHVIERMKICSELWKAGIPAEMFLKKDPKIKPQLSSAEESKTPLAIVFGTSEVQNGILQLKNLNSREQKEIKRANMIEEVKAMLSTLKE